MIMLRVASKKQEVAGENPPGRGPVLVRVCRRQSTEAVAGEEEMLSNHFMVTLPSTLEMSSSLCHVMQELAEPDQGEGLHKHNGLGSKVVQHCAG